MNQARRQKYLQEYRCGNLKMMLQREEWTKEHPDYLKKWRARNPQYFVEWRRKNPDYFKNWLAENREHRRNYMLHYMRKYRKNLNLKTQAENKPLQLTEPEETK